MYHTHDRGAFDSAKNHKRQSITAKREKLQTPKFVGYVKLGYVKLGWVKLGEFRLG